MLRRSPPVHVVRTTIVIAALLTAACVRAELVSPSGLPASPTGTLTVADMLPTVLHGDALLEHPSMDPTTGALSQLVRRLGKTSADVEAAGRITPDDARSRASVQGFRIGGVDGARLLAEETALIREILGREVQGDVPAEVVSFAGKEVTRLAPPHADQPLYLLVSRDTIFLIGGADESEAEELVRQIP